MSTLSELLFQAYGEISNPFVLCTLISKRTRQFMMSAKGNRNTVEIRDYVLDELLAGALEFEMHGEKEPKSSTPLLQSGPTAAPTEYSGWRQHDRPD